ncbi:hypothetical protein [Arthrobacter sp. W4I7]|uniref:hypothetical protein n=1 Tax=Arthrobacter sp. W4I7 TaxID=3042296 RepID=UPI00277EE897|nr:hypothetical protein [Arthrobacter sp. W4I7]MDQ0691275.1 hypothetical protein [Arthrobacter sp. W4I7]
MKNSLCGVAIFSWLELYSNKRNEHDQQIASQAAVRMTRGAPQGNTWQLNKTDKSCTRRDLRPLESIFYLDKRLFHLLIRFSHFLDNAKQSFLRDSP